jgi:hypothetical protein
MKIMTMTIRGIAFCFGASAFEFFMFFDYLGKGKVGLSAFFLTAALWCAFWGVWIIVNFIKFKKCTMIL